MSDKRKRSPPLTISEWTGSIKRKINKKRTDKKKARLSEDLEARQQQEGGPSTELLNEGMVSTCFHLAISILLMYSTFDRMLTIPLDSDSKAWASLNQLRPQAPQP